MNNPAKRQEPHAGAGTGGGEESGRVSWDEARRFALEVLAESRDIAVRLQARLEWLQAELQRLRALRLETDERLEWLEGQLSEMMEARARLEHLLERPPEVVDQLEQRNLLFPAAGEPQVQFSSQSTETHSRLSRATGE